MDHFDIAKLMAQKLYDLLVEDTEGCCDADVTIYEDQVTYEDQGGKCYFIFGDKIVGREGCLSDTFCVDTKAEFAEEYVNERTSSVEFWETMYGSIKANIANQYETYEDMKAEMYDGPCRYLDLEAVFAILNTIYE